MDELIQVAFFAVIIIASILDGVARKKRQARRDAEEVSASQEGYPEPGSEISTYDDESSEVIVAPVDSGEDQRAESMIPPDLWEEITALAQGERPQAARPPPAPPAPPPVRVEELSAWEQSKRSSGVSQEAPMWQGRGSDWDETESTAWGRDERSEAGRTHSHAITHPHGLSAPATVVTRNARGGGVLPLGDRKALRQAFLLKELLSTPRGLVDSERLPMEDE